MNNGSGGASSPDISEMLNRILSDPQAMSGVMKLAGGLMNGGEGSAANEAERPPANGGGEDANRTANASTPSLNSLGLGNVKLPKLLSYDADRVKLLEALKPYLGDGRRDKISYLLNIMRILKLLEGGMS